jgi:hypothetical protein
MLGGGLLKRKLTSISDTSKGSATGLLSSTKLSKSSSARLSLVTSFLSFKATYLDPLCGRSVGSSLLLASNCTELADLA